MIRLRFFSPLMLRLRSFDATVICYHNQGLLHWDDIGGQHDPRLIRGRRETLEGPIIHVLQNKGKNMHYGCSHYTHTLEDKREKEIETENDLSFYWLIMSLVTPRL